MRIINEDAYIAYRESYMAENIVLFVDRPLLTICDKKNKVFSIIIQVFVRKTFSKIEY